MALPQAFIAALKAFGKAAGRLAARGAAKAGKLVVKAGAKVISKVPTKLIVSGAKWVQANPTKWLAITAAIEGGRAIADAIEDAKIRSEAAGDIKKLLDYLQNQSSLNPESPLSFEMALNPEAPAQHPTFYFKPEVKLSAQFSDDRGYGDNSRFDYGVIHNFVITKGVEAAAGTNISLLIPDATIDVLYDAYTTFYARLNQAPPKSKDLVRNEFAYMLNSSSIAYGLLRDAKRYYDGNQVLFNGDDQIVNAFIAQHPVHVIKSHKAQMHAAGCLYVTKKGSTTDPNDPVDTMHPMYQEITTSDVTAASNAYPSMSNDTWNICVSHLKSLPIADNVADFYEYFFSGVFRDKVDEDLYEYYSFYPQTELGLSKAEVGIPRPSVMQPNSDASWKTYFDSAVTYTKQFMRGDKAYPSILSYFGLLPASPGVTPAKGTSWRDRIDFKRDPLHKTLNFLDCTDDFYRALANAKYNVLATDRSGQQMKTDSWSTWESFTFDTPSDMRVAFGRRQPLREGYQAKKPYPTYTEISAGEVASALKFAKPFNLYVLPKCLWLSDQSKFVLVNPVIDNWTVKTTMPFGSYNATNALTKDNMSNLTTYQEARLLPMGLRPTADSLDEDTLGALERTCSGTYNPVASFDLVKLIDNGSSVLTYMLSNFMWGTDQLAGYTEVLNKLEVFYAVNA